MTRMHAIAAAALLYGAAFANGQSDEEKLRQQAIKEKIDYLQDKTKALPEPGGKDPLINAFFKDGLFFKSSDGNFESKIGGRVYMNYRGILDRFNFGGAPGSGQPVEPVDSFFTRTARLQYDGTFYKDFFVRVEFEGPTVALKDGYIGWKASDLFTIKMGQMKGPISQEETCSSRFIDFADRSLLNRLAIGHENGIMANGKFMDSMFEYEAGVFDGMSIQKDFGRNAQDNNDAKDFMGRFRVSPFKTSPNDMLNNLRIGVSGTFGTLTNMAIPDITTPLSGIRIIDFNAAAIANGHHSRTGAEVSWAGGPLSIRAEFLSQYLRLLTPVQGNSIRLNALNAQVTYLLTGETKPVENRVKPKNNFNPSEGTWGAFELAARYASLEVKDAEATATNTLQTAGLPAVGGPYTANDKCTEITAGINWWWNPYTRLTIDYTKYTMGEDLPTQTGGDPFGTQKMSDEQLIMVRWQIDF